MIVAKLLRYALSVLFLFSALTKLFALKSVSRSLLAANLVPSYEFGYKMGIVLIAIEALAAIALLFKSWRAGASISLILTSLFVGYGVWRIRAGIGVPCSCFGAILSLSPIQSSILALASWGVSAILVQMVWRPLEI